MTLKELSALLELSQTTVSRALNGYPEVSERTRARVQQAARTHGYRPNARAQGLATGRSKAIGHVISLSDSGQMTNPIFGDFIAGAGLVYAEHGYEMLLSVVPTNSVETAYRDLASRRSVDGVIVQGPRMNDRRIPLLRDIGLPFVVHGRASGCSEPYDWVDVNNRAAFRRATRVLTDLGHRRIGLVNGDESQDFAHRRRQGYEDALTGAGIAPDPQRISSGDMSEPNGFRAASAMLDQPQPPTGFVVSSVVSAIGVRRAIAQRGLTMGRDVSVVCFDDALSYMESGTGCPTFTAMRSCVNEAGGHCARMVLSRISDPVAAPRHVLLEADLVIGQSTGPVPA